MFCAIVAAWGGGKLLADGADATASQPPSPLSGLDISQPLAAAPVASPADASPAAASTASSRASIATAPTAPPTASTQPPATSAPASAPAAPNQPPATPSRPSEAEEIAQQQALERLGKTYLAAIVANDAGALRGMLAGRCAGTDVAALLATRRAEVSAAAAAPIESITPLNQYVGHIDVGAGEAHTVLQFIASGQHAQTSSADGWLLEGGVWRSATC